MEITTHIVVAVLILLGAGVLVMFERNSRRNAKVKTEDASGGSAGAGRKTA